MRTVKPNKILKQKLIDVLKKEPFHHFALKDYNRKLCVRLIPMKILIIKPSNWVVRPPAYLHKNKSVVIYTQKILWSSATQKKMCSSATQKKMCSSTTQNKLSTSATQTKLWSSAHRQKSGHLLTNKSVVFC